MKCQCRPRPAAPNTSSARPPQALSRRTTLTTGITWQTRGRKYALGDLRLKGKPKWIPFACHISLHFRRERGNCKICYFTAATTDFEVSGGTGIAIKGTKSGKCCGYGNNGAMTTYDCLVIPSASATTIANMPMARLTYSEFCGSGKKLSSAQDVNAPGSVCCEFERTSKVYQTCLQVRISFPQPSASPSRSASSLTLASSPPRPRPPSNRPGSS